MNILRNLVFTGIVSEKDIVGYVRLSVSKYCQKKMTISIDINKKSHEASRRDVIL